MLLCFYVYVFYYLLEFIYVFIYVQIYNTYFHFCKYFRKFTKNNSPVNQLHASNHTQHPLKPPNYNVSFRRLSNEVSK